MLAMGRALMARPTVLLLDEPSMGLSPILVETIFQIVQDINRQGTTILLVEQNARMALRVAHRGLRHPDGPHRALGHRLGAPPVRRRAQDVPRREVVRRWPARPSTSRSSRVGARYRTLGRTVSDFEILQFVTLTGFTEPLFMDSSTSGGRACSARGSRPGVLTFALAEGLTLQTGILHGTGLALLSYDVRVLAPVLAGDTISVEIEVVDRRETKKPDRGVVTFRHRIANQRGEAVMEATITRMIKRRPP